MKFLLIALGVLLLACSPRLASTNPEGGSTHQESNMVRRHLEADLRSRDIDISEQGLIAALSHEDESVREQAAILLGMHKARGAPRALRAALQDSSPLVRIEAACALAQLDSRAGLSTLREGLTLKRYYGRDLAFRAASCLARLGEVDGFQTIKEKLAADSTGQRISALDQLGALRNE